MTAATWIAVEAAAIVLVELALLWAAMTGRFGTWRWTFIDATPLVEAKTAFRLRAVESAYQKLAWIFSGATVFLMAPAFAAALFRAPILVGVLGIIAIVPTGICTWTTLRAVELSRLARERMGLGGWSR